MKKEGLIQGYKLIVDATLISVTITYPNDVKVLEIVRDYLPKEILDAKKTFDPDGGVRTYRRTAEKVLRYF